MGKFPQGIRFEARFEVFWSVFFRRKAELSILCQREVLDNLFGRKKEKIKYEILVGF